MNELRPRGVSEMDLPVIERKGRVEVRDRFEGRWTGEFEVDDVPGTSLALLSMAIDVARWYTPDVRRTPAMIEASYGALAVRLARAGG